MTASQPLEIGLPTRGLCPYCAPMLIRTFLALAAGLSFANAELKFKDGDRVLWLGDSVTANGTHIAYVDAYLRARWPDKNIHFMNLGLPSETACGLSEPHHPWPRPDVHERIDRVIDKLDFDWAVVCYGVNDGIYHPFNELRFTRYTDGITRLVDKLSKGGAKVILVSPAAFDAGSVNPKRLLPDGGGDYGFRTPYVGYNEVMLKYAEWTEDFEGPAELKINITRPVTDAIAARRAVDPKFKTGDGVHPNAEGYLMIAKVLLENFGIPQTEFGTGLDLNNLLSNDLPAPQRKIVDLAQKRNSVLSVSYREHVGHRRPGAPKNPMPLPDALEKSAALEKEIRSTAKELGGQ